jgi:hypothetical protein
MEIFFFNAFSLFVLRWDKVHIFSSIFHFQLLSLGRPFVVGVLENLGNRFAVAILRCFSLTKSFDFSDFVISHTSLF